MPKLLGSPPLALEEAQRRDHAINPRKNGPSARQDTPAVSFLKKSGQESHKPCRNALDCENPIASCAPFPGNRAPDGMARG